MPGRHVPPSLARSLPRGRDVVVTIVLVVTLGLSGVAVALGLRTDPSTAADGGCAGSLTLGVLVTPALAGPVEAVAANWERGHPRVGSRCLKAVVTPTPDATAESAVFAPSADGPAVWIPDSTLWAQHLAADITQTPVAPVVSAVDPGIASSPIVIATTPARATRLATSAPAALTEAIKTGTPSLALLDPATQSAGLLSLLALRSALTTPATSTGTASPTAPSTGLLALMTRLSHDTVASPAAGFTALQAGRSTMFGTSEQAVIAQNRSAGRTVAAAIYSATASYRLDYPVVRLTRNGGDPGLGAATAQFEAVLRTTSSQTLFTAAGFRDPAGAPLLPTGLLGAARLTTVALPTADVAADVLRLWSAAQESSHTLAVMDVSGSMDEAAGNGQTKIQLAASAATEAVSLFTDDSAFGLWSFSSNGAGHSPWTELAPVAALGSTTAGETQRQRLIAAADALPTMVGGSTALYDTTLAAFQQVRNTYDPGKANSVVLLTDGQNEYTSGISLDALLTQLRLSVDATRPVPIITIGIGPRADLDVLREISAATGGKTYAVGDPNQIGSVFLDAVLERECRPDC